MNISSYGHRKIRSTKSEIRNNFKYQMTKSQNNKLRYAYVFYKFMLNFGTLEDLNFGFVSDFDIRISSLLAKFSLKTFGLPQFTY